MTPIKIAYETFGNPNHSPLILISGFGSQLINWPQKLLDGLAEKDFYVIVFDNRDVGLSTYYDHLETPNLSDVIALKEKGIILDPPYSLNDMASDIILLMATLAVKKAHIAGVSMGGMIAQIFASEFPDRILSLTCIATTSGDNDLPSPSPEVMNFFSSPSRAIDNLEGFLEHRLKIFRIYNHPDAESEIAAREIFKKTYERAYHPEGSLRQLLAIISAKPRNENLKNLKTHTLIIHGDSDPAFSIEHAEQLNNLIPKSRLEIIENMGHGLPEAALPKIVELIVEHLQFS